LGVGTSRPCRAEKPLPTFLDQWMTNDTQQPNKNKRHRMER
jgi:hypothetical protein